jgi:hypothetical protein
MIEIRACAADFAQLVAAENLMGSDLTLPPVLGSDIIHPPEDGGLLSVHHGGTGTDALPRQLAHPGRDSEAAPQYLCLVKT